jgi:hypothetical protein
MSFSSTLEDSLNTYMYHEEEEEECEQTMHGVVDGEPSTDDVRRVAGEEWCEVDVHFADGIVCTVGVIVQHSNVQRLVLKDLIINLSVNQSTTNAMSDLKKN